uniref:Uncharacterized protein n=1 Tax=Anguilla anguilla TaxID=7936 RepID=A0A0E9TSE8_ANGAN
MSSVLPSGLLGEIPEPGTK